MAFFNEFKEKFNKAAQSVSTKTRESVEMTRLIGESRSVSGELTTLYEQIGRIYVDSRGADTEAMASLCTRVDELRGRLDALERQRMQLKNQNRCPACGAVMARDAKFCSSCGRRMPEPVPETQAAPELEDVVYCPECGAMRKDADAFCAVCGHSFESNASFSMEEKHLEQEVQETSDEDGDEAPEDCNAE